MNRRDPLRTALVTCSLLILAGLVFIGLGKRVVARTLDVYDQVPAMVSGGIGGLALVVLGCVLAVVQVGRACAEREAEGQAQVLARVHALNESKRRGAAEAAAAAQAAEALVAASAAPRRRRARA